MPCRGCCSTQIALLSDDALIKITNHSSSFFELEPFLFLPLLFFLLSDSSSLPT